MAERTCTEPGCGRPHFGRGLCNKHHQREWAAGRLPPLPPISREQRFWAKVNKTDTCWLWTGAHIGPGYGHFSYEGGSLAHRYAYELLVGPIPEGLQIDHLCRVRNCVNPAHMEPVTPAENMRRSNSASGANARKTHCKYGHEFTEANTRIDRQGVRICRACIREQPARRLRRMDAEQIVRALADDDPGFEGLPAGGYLECALCHVVLEGHHLDPRTGGEREAFSNPHTPDCPWRLAQEWVAAHPS